MFGETLFVFLIMFSTACIGAKIVNKHYLLPVSIWILIGMFVLGLTSSLVGIKLKGK